MDKERLEEMVEKPEWACTCCGTEYTNYRNCCPRATLVRINDEDVEQEDNVSDE